MGGQMNENDRDVLSKLTEGISLLTQKIEHQNEMTRQQLAQNEKDHHRFDNEFKDISQILQQDRDAARSQMEKIMEQFGKIAVLFSKYEELKKVVEDRRFDSRDLYTKVTEVSDNVNKVGNATRKYTDDLLAPVENRVDEIEKVIAGNKGWVQSLNWIITFIVAAATIIVGVLAI